MIWLLAKVAGIALGIYLIRRNSIIAKIVGWILVIIQVLDILIVLS